MMENIYSPTEANIKQLLKQLGKDLPIFIHLFPSPGNLFIYLSSLKPAITIKMNFAHSCENLLKCLISKKKKKKVIIKFIHTPIEFYKRKYIKVYPAKCIISYRK